MKTYHQDFLKAKEAVNRKPIFLVEDIEKLCGSTPSVNIGEIKLKANIFGSMLMKIISFSAVGALIFALYFMNTRDESIQTTEYQIVENPLTKEHTKSETSSGTKQESKKVDITKTKYNYYPQINFSPEENLYAALPSLPEDNFKAEDSQPVSIESTLMGYPIFLLSIKEAENIGFMFDDDEIHFKHTGRLVIPIDNDYKSNPKLVEKMELARERFSDYGYILDQDSLISEIITISEKLTEKDIIDKDDIDNEKISTINLLKWNYFSKEKNKINVGWNSNSLSIAPPYQLSQYMAERYKSNLESFELDYFKYDQIHDKTDCFYVDTRYKIAEVFKHFAYVVVKLPQTEEQERYMTAWVWMNQELSEKLPARYAKDIKHKFIIQEEDLYSEDQNQITIEISEDSDLPWSKIKFVPNHLPIYGTKREKNTVDAISSHDFEKIIDYFKPSIRPELNYGASNNVAQYNSLEEYLVGTISQSYITNTLKMNSLVLDSIELDKIGINSSKNEVAFESEYINENQKIDITRLSYKFDKGQIKINPMGGYFAMGWTKENHYSLTYASEEKNYNLHNFNPISPICISMQDKFQFYNSPILKFATNDILQELYNKQTFFSSGIRFISAEKKLPFFIYEGEELDTLGTVSETNAPFIAMLDRLIPVKIQPEFPDTKTLYIWYLPTTEFLNALPERYSKSIRQELEILDKIDNQNISPEVACKGFEEESFLGICDLSSGALSNIKIAPNPCLYQLNLSFTASEKRSVSLEIFDINGKRIQILGNFDINNYGEQQHTFDVSSLKIGIYQLVIVSDKGEKISKRFIKQ